MLHAVCLVAMSFAVSLAAERHAAAATHEWRTLAAAPGRLDALHAELRDHVLPAAHRHGVPVLIVAVPVGDNPDPLVHLVVTAGDDKAAPGHADRLAGMSEWRAVVGEGDTSEPLATERGRMRLQTTPWSPTLPRTAADGRRVFERRTYTSPDAARRTALLARFEHHTLALFAKHGMTNLVYWVPVDGDPAETMLVYLLAHESVDAAQANFDGFRKDPEWTAARTASEAAAGGSLTIKERGVVSEFLVPTEYSPVR